MLNIEPEFTLPACYNVQPPPANTKIGNFSDETLFFIFYSQPRDAMQEMAAHELSVSRIAPVSSARSLLTLLPLPLRLQLQAQLAVPQGTPTLAHQGSRIGADPEDGDVRAR